MYIILKPYYVYTFSHSKLKDNTYFTKKLMILFRTKCDQQYHIKSSYSHSPISHGLKESLNTAMSVGLKFTRRRVTEETQKQFSLEKCYTLIKKSATHCLKKTWIASLVFSTTIHFNCSRSHLSHGKRSPAVSTPIRGSAPTPEKFSPT